jgi:aerobic carbon-monoxide dehydrogenase large subunit
MPDVRLGDAVRRREDADLVTGVARYVDDLALPGTLHAVFVRSVSAHARIRVDLDAARALPGVVGVFGAADLALPPVRPADKAPAVFARPVLAEDVVRFAGEAIAVVVAETRAEAIDAAEAVEVDYDPLGVVVDAAGALTADAPLLFPGNGSNVATDREYAPAGGVLDGAEVVVRARFVNQRLVPAPLETDAILVAPDGDGLTVWAATQTPFDVRRDIARALGMERDQVRVIAPAVGGGFGAKMTRPEQLVVAAVARRLGRPVGAMDTRSESMLAMTHGRDQLQEVELGATRDGQLVGIGIRVTANLGAYVMVGAELPELTYEMACGVYRIPKVAFQATCVVTNTTPTGAYRGAGRPEATALIERAMDLLAGELGLDPAELRRRNLIPPEAFPWATVTGVTYDSGEYERALDELLRLAGYEQLRAEQAARRERGAVRQLGVGLAVYVEVTAVGPTKEFGSVEVAPDGCVTVMSGISPHGQGHETALAQVAAAELRVPLEAVKVVLNDTGTVPRGAGTYGSRSLQLGGTAVHRAAEAVVGKARQLAAEQLEAAVDDVVQLDGGRFGIAGVPDRALGLAELAAAATDPARLPAGMEPGLAAALDVDQGACSYPFGAHLAVVECDTETGKVQLLRHVTVDDCGRVVNPILVEGQVHGGIAQGAAQALFEHALYDADGNLLTGSLASYAMPSAAELPSFETSRTETPTPLNPLGAKGIGEAATIGSTPAIQNAVVDALSHLGVRHIDMPLTPERVWSALRRG